MRKLTLVLTLAVALLALGAGAVFAQEEPAGTTGEEEVSAERNNQVVHCHRVPCRATGSSDLVYERVGNGKRDKILLGGGRDQVRADTYRNDKDVIRGSAGFDLIYVDDNDLRDKIFGGAGNDKCYVDSRREIGGGCSVVIVR